MTTYPRSVVSCLVSDDFEIFHDFKLSKPKRETRLFHYVIPALPP